MLLEYFNLWYSAECGFGKGSIVMMYNRKLEKAENLNVGDKLMGDDSSARHVLSITPRSGELYKNLPNFG